jgi:iron complex outermembrane receptor protein
LENSAVKSVPEALGLLGIDTQSRSLNYGVQTDFSHRALNFEGLSILLNGLPINDPQTGHHSSDIPLTLEDIQSLKLDPLAATVDIVSRIPRKSKNIFEISRGEHRTSLGRLSISEKKENLGLRFSLERAESDGFRYGTDFKTLIASLLSGIEFSQEESGFLLLGYGEKEFGAYDFYTPNKDYPSKEWTKTFIFNAGLNLQAQSYSLRSGFLWRRHFDKFMLDRTQIKSDYLNHHRTDAYRGSLSLALPESFFDFLCLNAKFEEERINSTNLGKHSRGNYNISAEIEEELTNRLIFDNMLTFDYFDDFKNKISGSIRLNYLLNRQRFGFGVFYKIRKPTFTELYYEDPTTEGNLSLLPEELLTYELSYDYKQEELDAGLAIFFRKEDNLINWVKREPTEKWRANNILQAECFGIEANLKLRFNTELSAGFNYSYIDKDLKDSGRLYKYGPNYASHLLNSFFEFDLPLFSSLIELEYKKRPNRDGWILVNLAIRRKMSAKAELFCKASNIFNVEYQDIEGIPSPGRWVEAGVRLEW